MPKLATAPDPKIRPATLLVLHRHDARLLAVLKALAAAGQAVVGVPGEVRADTALAAGDIGALLVAPRDHGFARACRAAHPTLGVIYLAARPQPGFAPADGECLLKLPFTEAELAAALAAVRPGAA